LNKNNYKINNDEPTKEDTLEREHYAEAFANIAETCYTPLVVGIYGTWGMGKTSLMQQIEDKLDKNKTISIWFDPWLHQFDENPILSLAHKIVDELGTEMKEDWKEILFAITVALSSVLLKRYLTMKSEDIEDPLKKYEEDNFIIRDVQVKLKEHFNNLVKKAKGKENKRLVFFIDDLDRCTNKQALKLLEALKLYLNIEECVYFLGLDPKALGCVLNFL